ncbi:tyrosine-type recombinase/integrase [Aliivibrio salmonicida]|uniref:tyrosine-type recombinase/integrase n=1 Tax=Aliivibrio salmonicida TaxID=40269 RepID=UPI003D12C910
MKKPIINCDLIHNLKVKRTPYDHGLGGGLVVRVSRSGYKSLQFKYRFNGRKKTLTIGDIELYDENEILVIWKRIRAELDAGLCPMSESRKRINATRTQSLSIHDLSDIYIKEHVSTLKRPEQSEYLINKHIKLKVGKLQAYELELSHVHKMTKEMAPTVARKATERLHSILNYGINKGLISIQNPLGGNVKNFGKKAGKTERTLSFDDINVLLERIEDSGLDVNYQAVTLLLLLTGQRKQEWLDARWDEVCFKNKTLTIPPHRLKTAKDTTGKSKSHTVHLSKLVIDILTEQHTRTGHKDKVGRVFSSVNKGYYNQALTESIKAMRMAHFTPHDLRRTFFTRNVDNGVDVFVLEKILNHKMTGVLAHYNLSEYTNQRIEALEDWSNCIKNKFKAEPL